MTAMILAHAGDWIALGPVLIAVGWLWVKNWRERRAQRREPSTAEEGDGGEESP